MYGQPPQGGERKYTEEDILMLIKFIVKEFAKIVQRWSGTQSFGLPMFGLNAMPQPNINSMLLATLLSRDTMNFQNQDMAQQNLLNQVNPSALLDMLDQNKYASGDTTPMDRSKNLSVHSYPVTSIPPKEKASKEHTDDIKVQDNDRDIVKDEVETIQSSEDKTNKRKSISEDTTNPPKKIDIDEVYSILKQNNSLHNLINKFSRLG